jgi:hypothetical protein
MIRTVVGLTRAAQQTLMAWQTVGYMTANTASIAKASRVRATHFISSLVVVCVTVTAQW